MKRYRAKRGQSVPMPDRPGQYMPDSGEGTSVDEMNPFYARMIADGDLVEVKDEAPNDDPPPAPVADSPPPPAKPTEGKK